MRKIGLVVAMIAVLVTAATAQMAYVDYNIMGTGARARGMGGAFIGVADDATAISWNPAGIAQLEKMEASAVGLFNMKQYSGEFTFGGVTENQEESDKHFAPAFASFALPLKVSEKNLVLAAAYQRLIDMGSVTKDEDSDVYGDYTYTDKISGGIDAITPAIAMQITPMISLGAVGNIYVNGYEEKYNKTYPTLANGTDNYTHTYKFKGFNFNLGGLVSTQKFNIGATVKMPFTMTQESEMVNNWDFTANGGNSGTYDTTYPDSKITMPLMLGIGIAFKPTDKLTLAADFERRGYSNTEITEKDWSWDGSNWVLKDTTYNAEMKDCNQFRVGLEYIFSGPNAVFPVRLGFRTDPKTYNKWEGTFSAPDTVQAVGKVLTGGFGLVMGRMMLDLAYEYGMTTMADLEEAGNTVIVKEKTHNIMASAIFHF